MADAGSFVLAEVMLWLMYIAIAATLVVTTVSAIRPLLIAPQRNAGNRGWLVIGLTVVLLLVTYFLGSDQPLNINGAVYRDAFWLKVTDMLLLSALILIVIAVGFVCFGASGLSRKFRLKIKH